MGLLQGHAIEVHAAFEVNLKELPLANFREFTERVAKERRETMHPNLTGHLPSEAIPNKLLVQLDRPLAEIAGKPLPSEEIAPAHAHTDTHTHTHTHTHKHTHTHMRARVHKQMLPFSSPPALQKLIRQKTLSHSYLIRAFDNARPDLV